MTEYQAQKFDAARTVGSNEMRYAIMCGKRVKIESDPDTYGCLYKGELYVPIFVSEEQ